MTIMEGPAGAIMRYFAYSKKALPLFELAVKIEIEKTSARAMTLLLRAHNANGVCVPRRTAAAVPWLHNRHPGDKRVSCPAR